MRCITKYQIKKMGCVIPNLDRMPSISLEVLETDPNWKEFQYYWTNPETNEKELLIHLVLRGDWLDCRSYNNTRAVLSGLFKQTPYSWVAVMDALYYACNPVKYRKQIGLTLINKLIIRLDQRSISNHSTATHKMINDVVGFILHDLPKPTESSTLQEIQMYADTLKVRAYPLTSQVRFDIQNLTWVDATSAESITTRIGKFYVGTLEEAYPKFNLVQYISDATESFLRYRTSNYYIVPETEVVYDSTIYLRSEIVLEHCSVCNAEHLAQLLSSDGCPTCLRDQDKIHNYSTKVPDLLKFKATKVKPNTLYLGAELEYESAGSRSKDAVFANIRLKNHAILKSDGSIRNGFEIVTCPATLDIHLVEFKRFFNELKDKSKLHGESNTGMHVHISRKPLSMLTVGKMTAFLNNKDNKKFIEQLAGRKLNTYCQQEERTVSFPLVYGTGGARYNVLNLNNRDTVELRIFSTPESYEDFAHKLEFSEALAIYCSPCTVNHSVYSLLKFPNFINWVNTMKHSYPYLVAKLKTI